MESYICASQSSVILHSLYRIPSTIMSLKIPTTYRMNILTLANAYSNAVRQNTHYVWISYLGRFGFSLKPRSVDTWFSRAQVKEDEIG